MPVALFDFVPSGLWPHHFMPSALPWLKGQSLPGQETFGKWMGDFEKSLPAFLLVPSPAFMVLNWLQSLSTAMDIPFCIVCWEFVQVPIHRLHFAAF